MIPMMPLCDPRGMVMPMNPGMMAAPVGMMPMACAPVLCQPNNFNLFSISSLMNEYDSQMYGRFQHVERENPYYRHAPFDWYRPPKQCYNIIHEDAAVVTHDGPVPIGDFYRYYIYGDDTSDYDEYDEYDSGSVTSDDFGDLEESSYEPRRSSNRRYARQTSNFDDDDLGYNPGHNSTSRGTGNYSTLNRARQNTNPTRTNQSSNFRGNRTLAGDDEFDDAASVNSTYAN